MLSALSVVSAPGAVLVLLVGCLVRIIYAFYFSPYRHIPGPAICKITGLWTGYQDVLLRRNEAIHQWHRKYGGVVLIAPGEVSFSTPGPTKEIYGTTGKHPKSSYFSNFIMYGERPIFATLGVRDHRQLLKRTFGFYQKCNIYKAENIQPIEASAQTFLNELGGATTGWTTVDVLLLCNFYSFDNITRLVYGARHSARTLSTDCEERRILEGWKECELWNNFLYNLPFTRWPLMTSVSLATGNRGFLKGEDRLSDWNMEKLRSIIEDPENVDLDSLLGRLYMRKSEKGEPISIKWIAAEVLDNMHAAQTTVALALTYALWNLACEPKWQIKLRDELSALPRSENGMPRFADIDAAPMLDACIRESNRLNPLSSGHAERVVPATKAYQDVVIPAGVSILILGLKHVLADSILLRLAFRCRQLLFTDQKLRSQILIFTIRIAGCLLRLRHSLRWRLATCPSDTARDCAWAEHSL